MLRSEQINELASALSKAQGRNDRISENQILSKLYKSNYAKNMHTKFSFSRLFFEKIAWGMTDCWQWIGCKDSGGYGTLLNKNYKTTKAHRLSWISFKGEIPKGLNVLHKCDNPGCVNPEHLFLGSQNDNVQDMIKKGRLIPPIPRNGEKNPMHKLTHSQVLELRELYSKGPISYKKLSKIYGVAPMTIHRAATKKSWRHI